MTKQIKKIFLLGMPMASIIMPVLTYAATSQEGWNPEAYSATGLSGAKPEDILLKFIDWAIILVGILGVIVFIYAGFLYLTARGETDNIDTAKRVVLWGVVGIAVAVLGLVAVRTVDSLIRGDGGGSGGNGGGNPSSSGAPSGQPAPPGSGSLPTTPDMVQ